MPRPRLWLLVGSLLLAACAAAPASAPDPAATEAAIQAAVAATATALAVLQPTLSPADATPAAPAAPTAAPAAPSTPRPSPTTARPNPATPAAATTATPGAGATPGTPAAAGTPATPRPAGTRTGPPLTGEEAAYIRGVVPFIQQFNQSFDRFAALISDPKPEDSSWRLQLSAELQLWADGADAAKNVRPPASMLPIHRQVVAGLDFYRQASSQITQALQQGDSDQIQQGLDSVQQGRQAFVEASREIDRLAQERGL